MPVAPQQTTNPDNYATPNATLKEMQLERVFAAAKAEWQFNNTLLFNIVNATLLRSRKGNLAEA